MKYDTFDFTMIVMIVLFDFWVFVVVCGSEIDSVELLEMYAVNVLMF